MLEGRSNRPNSRSRDLLFALGTVIVAVLAFVVGLGLELWTSKSLTSQTFVLGIALAVIGVLCTWVFETRRQVLDRLDEVEKALQLRVRVDTMNSIVARELGLDILERTSHLIDNMHSGRFEVGANWVTPIALWFLDNTKLGDNVFATSYIQGSEWWDEVYQRANVDAARRGVKIERIYIYDDPSEIVGDERTCRWISNQERANITVKLLRKDDVSDPQDVIIFRFNRPRSTEVVASKMLLAGRILDRAEFHLGGTGANELENTFFGYSELNNKSLKDLLDE